MFSNKKKKSKSSNTDSVKKKARSDKKKMDISLLSVIDNMTFSKKHVTAYYKIGGSKFDFMSTKAQIYEAQRVTLALNNLMNDRQDPMDLHILTTSDPFDVDAWEQQVHSMSSSWEQPDDFNDFVQEMYAHLYEQNYSKKVVYVGVVLGTRGALDVSGLNPLEAGLQGALETAKEWLNNLAHVPNEVISASEEDEYRNKEVSVFRTLSANIQAERVRSEELLLVVKRMFYPFMPPQFLDVDHDSRLGPGDIVLEGASVVTESPRWLKFDQIIGAQEWTGYRSCLTLTKFPKHGDFPNNTLPFFYIPQTYMELPLTTYARITLTPVEKIKGKIAKKKDEQKDEIKNYSVGRDGVDNAVSGAPADIVESLESIQQIEYEINANKMPWVTGSYHVIIDGPDTDTIKAIFEGLKSTYSDMQIGLTMSAGDQLDLFLEQMPGDRKRIKSFDQVTNLNMIAASGFNISSNVGDLIQESDKVSKN